MALTSDQEEVMEMARLILAVLNPQKRARSFSALEVASSLFHVDKATVVQSDRRSIEASQESL